jgi:hypothetical protein
MGHVVVSGRLCVFIGDLGRSQVRRNKNARSDPEKHENVAAFFCGAATPAWA